jgi:hypothetical protein
VCDIRGLRGTRLSASAATPWVALEGPQCLGAGGAGGLLPASPAPGRWGPPPACSTATASEARQACPRGSPWAPNICPSSQGSRQIALSAPNALPGLLAGMLVRTRAAAGKTFTGRLPGYHQYFCHATQ